MSPQSYNLLCFFVIKIFPSSYSASCDSSIAGLSTASAASAPSAASPASSSLVAIVIVSLLSLSGSPSSITPHSRVSPLPLDLLISWKLVSRWGFSAFLSNQYCRGCHGKILEWGATRGTTRFSMFLSTEMGSPTQTSMLWTEISINLYFEDQLSERFEAYFLSNRNDDVDQINLKLANLSRLLGFSSLPRELSSILLCGAKSGFFKCLMGVQQRQRSPLINGGAEESQSSIPCALLSLASQPMGFPSTLELQSTYTTSSHQKKEAGSDAKREEVDQCQGSSENQTLYHYFSFSPCVYTNSLNANGIATSCSISTQCTKDYLTQAKTYLPAAQMVKSIVSLARDGHLIIRLYKATDALWQPCDYDACNCESKRAPRWYYWPLVVTTGSHQQWSCTSYHPGLDYCLREVAHLEL